MSQKIPESIGASVPTNGYELMKQLRAAEREQQKGHVQQQKQNRMRKLEIQRETLECHLMEAEDYIGTAEGKRREMAYEDRVNM